MKTQIGLGMQGEIKMPPAPKSNIGTIIATALITAFVVGTGMYLVMRDNAGPEVTATPTTILSNTPNTTPLSANKTYENRYMKITIPAGWTYNETQIGALNIIKNNYILYINPRISQASGIMGGRFSEIAMGAPSADAVILGHPTGPCGVSEASRAMVGHRRFDLYINSRNSGGVCMAPADGSSVWYFSYLSKDGYFSYFGDGGDAAYIITMAYNSRDVNQLPRKGNATLNAMLGEMTSILETLVLK